MVGDDSEDDFAAVTVSTTKLVFGQVLKVYEQQLVSIKAELASAKSAKNRFQHELAVLQLRFESAEKDAEKRLAQLELELAAEKRDMKQCQPLSTTPDLMVVVKEENERIRQLLPSKGATKHQDACGEEAQFLAMIEEQNAVCRREHARHSDTRGKLSDLPLLPVPSWYTYN